MTEHTIDQHGWIKTDEKIPANLEKVLIYDDECGIRIVQFNMYSPKRYEFIDEGTGEPISIYQIRFWQSLPKAPIDAENF